MNQLGDMGDNFATVPLAAVQTTRPNSRRWSFRVISVMTLAAAAVTAMIFWARGESGGQISIRFRQGHGLRAGDPVRHLDIEVGVVEAVKLIPKLDGIEVVCRLAPEASALAREGTRFWIARPQISLTKSSGLDTVVGPKYIALAPGPSDAAPADRFEGLEHPLTLSGETEVTVTVRFRDGHGVSVGDLVRYRGIAIGEVTQVELDRDLREVVLDLRLLGNAGSLAREGTLFWIARPSVSLTSVRGLDTIVGGRYVAAAPGPASANRQIEFLGLDEPPALPASEDGGLELVVETEHRKGIDRGSPVRFRGMPVGEVLSLAMASDGLTIEARVWIAADYRTLVRENSEFWNDSGMDVHLGLGGMDLDVGTLETIAAGGISFATPDPAGEAVHTGHRFVLQPEAPRDWQEWKPNLIVGSSLLPQDATFPAPLRAEFRSMKKLVGISRDVERRGFVLPLEDGRVVLPSSLLPIRDEADLPLRVAFAGKERTIESGEISIHGALAAFRDPENTDEEQRWPTGRMRRPKDTEDCLLIGGIGESPIALSRRRLTALDGRWLIDPAVPVVETSVGAAVVSRTDGAIVGVVDYVDGAASVALVADAIITP
jgi:paraquat-inducible protein B